MVVPWNVALTAPSVARMIFTCTLVLGAVVELPQLSQHTARMRSARPLAAGLTTGSPKSVARRAAPCARDGGMRTAIVAQLSFHPAGQPPGSKFLTPARPSAIVTNTLRDPLSLPDVDIINGTESAREGEGP